MITQLEDLDVSNSFAELSDRFYTRLSPSGVREPKLLHVNERLGNELGLSTELLYSDAMLAVFAGNTELPGGKALAAVYSGHQFGVWAGQLGDGRAHLLGAINSPLGPQELQLKGSGMTPYSRRGDGRAVVRSSVREYLASEAMYALGIPTTRALALVSSPVPVYRERIERAAVVTRVAPTFIRFGSFEHWLNQPEAMSELLRYTVEHFYPELDAQLADDELSLALLNEVTKRTAKLMAQWLTVGFCHGVMNTDNMSIVGLTLDYGPYGFMDGFQANHICNTTDQQGRYAWSNQPSIAHWNLYRLASALTTLGATPEQLEAAMAEYEAEFLRHYQHIMCRKFGLLEWQDDDNLLVDSWWRLLHQARADFTLSFRYLADSAAHPERFLALFEQPEPARQWLQRYHQRLQSDAQSPLTRHALMQQNNPLYVLRNHLAQQAIEGAEQGDMTVFNQLLMVLTQPYTEHSGYAFFAEPPQHGAASIPLSCSS